MATVSYYFDAYDGSNNWTTNPANMVDGDTGTFASTTTRLTDYQDNTGNTCPGTNLGTITKVELRAYGYYQTSGGVNLRLIPRFGGSSNGDNHDLALGTSAAWTSWTDITTDTNAPGSWAWSDVDNLDVRVAGSWGTGSRTVYCAKVEIQVTYTPGGTNYQGSVSVSRYHTAADSGLAARFGSASFGKSNAATDSGLAARFGATSLSRHHAATDGGLAARFAAITLARVEATTDTSLIAAFGQAALARVSAVSEAGLAAFLSGASLPKYNAIAENGLAVSFGVSALARVVGVSEASVSAVLASLLIGRVTDVSATGGLAILVDAVLARMAELSVAGNLAQMASMSLDAVRGDEIWGRAATSGSAVIGRFASAGDQGSKQAYGATALPRSLASTLSGLKRSESGVNVGVVFRTESVAGLYIVGDVETANLLDLLVDEELGVNGSVAIAALLDVAFDHFVAVQAGVQISKVLDIHATTGQFLVDVVLLDRQATVTLLAKAGSVRTLSANRVLGIAGISNIAVGSSANIGRLLALTLTTAAHMSASVSLSRFASVATSDKLGLYATIGVLGRIGTVGSSSLASRFAAVHETRRMFTTQQKLIGKKPNPTVLSLSRSVLAGGNYGLRRAVSLSRRGSVSATGLATYVEPPVEPGPQIGSIAFSSNTYPLGVIPARHSIGVLPATSPLGVIITTYSMSMRVATYALEVRNRYGPT